ncbi:hypothetical protein EBS02_08030 [bacterium]|nr:hypothetical protein [bacterium]
MIEITELFVKKEEDRLFKKYQEELNVYNDNLSEYNKANDLYEESKKNKTSKLKKPKKKDFSCDKEPKLERVKFSSKDIDFSALSANESYIYAASDAYQTLKLYRHLEAVRVTEKEALDKYPLVKASGQSFIYKVENKLIDALLDMECNKFRIDIDYIKRLTPFVINDIYTTMLDVYKDLRLPIDFGNKSDFFYRMTQMPFKAKVTNLEFPDPEKPIKSISCLLNGNPCVIYVKGDLLAESYKVSYSEGFLQNADATITGVPHLRPEMTEFECQMIYPEKTEFFLDSPIKVGHLLFTPKDREIDFYTGIPIETFTAEVNVGFADQVKTQTITVKGLRERLADDYSEDDVYRVKGFGVKGGKVTEKAGQWQTDDATLTPLAGQSRAIDAIPKYRKKKKNLSTYLMPFYNLKQAEDGNYYAKFAFRSMAAPSGRFAAGDKEGAGYIGMNAQAIPSNDAAFWVDAKRIFSR